MSRPPIATLAGLLFMAAYTLFAVALPDHLPPLHWSLQAIYWCIAGTIWVLPIWWLMLWGAGKR